MKYVFRLYARPDENESIKSKHSKLVEGLVSLGGSWGLAPVDYPAPEVGEELSAQFQLGKFLGNGIKGFVSYRFREGLRNESDCDDYIDLEFDPHRVDYAGLLNKVFPAYVECFDPYLAFVGDEEFTYIDFDRSRDFNHRSGVLRVYPANYFDEPLCMQAFAASADETVKRLIGVTERSEVFNGGAFFVVKGVPMSVEDAESVHERILGLLEEEDLTKGGGSH